MPDDTSDDDRPFDFLGMDRVSVAIEQMLDRKRRSEDAAERMMADFRWVSEAAERWSADFQPAGLTDPSGRNSPPASAPRPGHAAAAAGTRPGHRALPAVELISSQGSI